MKTLNTLNKKIKTAHDLLSVVKTMKNLAAVNIRRYERAVESLEQYIATIDMGWQIFFRSDTVILRKAAGKSAVCMVIGSDQGMCEQFNEILISHAMKEAERLKEKDLDLMFWSLGEKISRSLEDREYSIGNHFSVAESLSGINAQVQVVIQQIESWQGSRRLEHFYVCHNILTKRGGYKQIFYRLLPLDKEWADQYTAKKWPSRCLPQMDLPQQEMFTHLFRQYLFISLYRAFVQSLAGENLARLMAMQAAEKNIQEMEEDLLVLFRAQRQTSITNELLDISSGFEALSEEEFIV